MMPLFLAIEWSPNPVIFQLGSIIVKWYGLMYSLALIACYSLGFYFFKRDNLPLHKLLNLAILLFVSGIVGARLGQIIFYEAGYFLQHPKEILKIWKGGMASHGAFCLMVFTWWIYIKKNKAFNFWWGIDKLAIMGCLVVSLMRLGNLMNSEIIGKATNVPWAFIFTSRDFVPRHPVVLYEALAYFVYFLFFLGLYIKFPAIKKGWFTALFMLLLVPTRMALETFKAEAGYTQLLSIPLILIGFGFVVFKLKPFEN